MTAAVPRLLAAKQRTEVSVRMLKSPVHLLESRGIHFPAPLPKPSPITLLSYYASCRCNIRKVCTNRNLETAVCKKILTLQLWTQLYGQVVLLEYPVHFGLHRRDDELTLSNAC